MKILVLLLAACAAPAAAPTGARQWCYADQARKSHCFASENECEASRKATDIMLLACSER